MSDVASVLQFMVGSDVDLSKTDCCHLKKIKEKLIGKMMCVALEANSTVQVKDERWELDRYLRAIRELISWIDLRCDEEDGPAYFTNSRDGCERFCELPLVNGGWYGDPAT